MIGFHDSAGAVCWKSVCGNGIAIFFILTRYLNMKK